MARILAALIVSTSLAHAALATAQADPGAEPRRPEPRAVPDYDGRGAPPEDPAEPWMWIPRVATAPLYLVTEYLLRAPIGWLLTELEATGAITSLADYLRRDFVVLPVAYFDLGLRPSVRLFATWKHALHDANQIDVSAGFGGTGALDARVVDTITVDDLSVSARFRASRRDDYIYGGVGPGADNTIANRARFSEARLETEARLDWRFWRRSRLRLSTGYDSRNFGDGEELGDPALTTRQQQLADGVLPEGFEDGYSAFRARLELVMDTRAVSRPLDGGVRVGVYAAPGFDVDRPSQRRWLTWGGHLMLATDALGAERVLALEGDAHLVEDLDASEGVPFTELIDPSAAGVLPAYLPGQLRGRSAAAMTVRYRWPIWVFLDGNLFFSVGSVFDTRFDGFELHDLRYSFGVGVDARDAGDHPFVFQLGVGSETFANGGELTSFRVLIGARNSL